MWIIIYFICMIISIGMIIFVAYCDPREALEHIGVYVICCLWSFCPFLNMFSGGISIMIIGYVLVFSFKEYLLSLLNKKDKVKETERKIRIDIISEYRLFRQSLIETGQFKDEDTIDEFINGAIIANTLIGNGGK